MFPSSLFLPYSLYVLLKLNTTPQHFLFLFPDSTTNCHPRWNRSCECLLWRLFDPLIDSERPLFVWLVSFLPSAFSIRSFVVDVLSLCTLCEPLDFQLHQTRLTPSLPVLRRRLYVVLVKSVLEYPMMSTSTPQTQNKIHFSLYTFSKVVLILH